MIASKVQTELCCQCGRIAYVDRQRICKQCEKAFCHRGCCERNHYRACIRGGIVTEVGPDIR